MSFDAILFLCCFFMMTLVKKGVMVLNIFRFVIKMGEFIQDLSFTKSSCFSNDCKPFDINTVNFPILFFRDTKVNSNSSPKTRKHFSLETRWEIDEIDGQED